MACRQGLFDRMSPIMSFSNRQRRRLYRMILACLALSIALVLLAISRPGMAQSDSSQQLAQCRHSVQAGSQDIACLRALYRQAPPHWPAAHWSVGVAQRELGPLLPPTDPADNPSTAQKVALGKALFEDPRLSASGQIACASCHDRQLGWGDGRRVSFGHDRQPGRRNAMDVSMAPYSNHQFWDGRGGSLENQAQFPIHDPVEMANSIQRMQRQLRRNDDYRQQFGQIFGDTHITMDKVAKAMAAYQRTLYPRNRAFDRYLAGRDNALSDSQLLGLHLFRTKARCINCHNGPAMSDDSFHNLGIHFFGRELEDLGRFEVTGNPADSGAFRTPSLRNVPRNGPYMHNGLFPNLEGIVNMYNAGAFRPRPVGEQANDPSFPTTDPLLQPLGLSAAERQALVDFLSTL